MKIESHQYIGDVIRANREAAGVGLNSMASQIDVSSSYLSKIERTHERPGEDFLRRVAAFLGWTDDETDIAILRAGHIPVDVVEILKANPALLKVVRAVAHRCTTEGGER